MANQNVQFYRVLDVAFHEKDLDVFCLDYYPQVYGSFKPRMTKKRKIHLLIGYCQRRNIMPKLLATIQKVRPTKYAERFSHIPKEESNPSRRRFVRDPLQLFISHATKDAEFAHRLATDLQTRGWKVWIAPDSIQPGEKWIEAINRGLAESGIFILVLTRATTRSRWATSEANVAIQLEHQGRMLFVPLELENCNSPLLWNMYQRVPFARSYERGLTVLMGRLSHQPFKLKHLPT